MLENTLRHGRTADVAVSFIPLQTSFISILSIPLLYYICILRYRYILFLFPIHIKYPNNSLFTGNCRGILSLPFHFLPSSTTHYIFSHYLLLSPLNIVLSSPSFSFAIYLLIANMSFILYSLLCARVYQSSLQTSDHPL